MEGRSVVRCFTLLHSWLFLLCIPGVTDAQHLFLFFPIPPAMSLRCFATLAFAASLRIVSADSVRARVRVWADGLAPIQTFHSSSLTPPELRGFSLTAPGGAPPQLIRECNRSTSSSMRRRPRAPTTPCSPTEGQTPFRLLPSFSITAEASSGAVRSMGTAWTSSSS